MGEYLRELMERGRARVAAERKAPPKVHPLVIAVGVLTVGFLVAGVVRLSLIAVIFALVFGAAGWTWWLSDRARGQPKEIMLAAVSLVCLLAGFFGWLTGMIKGW